MGNALHKARLIFTDQGVRMRLLFLAGALAVFRLLAAIPIPGVDRFALEQFFQNNQFLGLLAAFSGGGFSHLSLVMLGVGPYITASIFMQLMTVIFPQVKRMYSEEGEAGRTKFTVISRLITIPIAILQSIAFLSLLSSQGIIVQLTGFQLILNVLLVTAGSILLMWIGELMTEFGIGNGVSLIIFAGIVARIPAGISQTLYSATAANIPAYVGFVAIALAVILAVVLVSEAERSVPIHHARQASRAAAPTYMPIRILQAGVIPIIFALSLILLPQLILNGLIAVGIHGLTGAVAGYAAFEANTWAYSAAYFGLVIMFTYFYTSITFEPHRIAENLQKTGAFVPGVRPGRETEKYLGIVVNRITLPGALFLGVVAVIPFVVKAITGVSAILVGGTALIIAVTVLLDVIRKVDAQTSLQEY